MELEDREDDTENIGGADKKSAEVERLIIEDPAVAEAAVVGLAESTGASALQAFLVPANGALIDESFIRAMHQRLLTRLSAFEVPHRFAIVDRLPRAADGQLLREVLRAESPAKPISELPSVEPQPGVAIQAERLTASNGQPVGGNAGEVPLKEQLGALQQERQRLVLEAVSAEAAKMLGESDARWVNRDLAFSELGFDSTMTVELCNRLAAATGLRLPQTVGWDYNSVSALAQYLDAELSGGDRRAVSVLGSGKDFSALEDELKKVEGMVAAIGAGDKQRVADRLRALLGAITGGEDHLGKRIQDASTPDEIFQLIDSELGE